MAWREFEGLLDRAHASSTEVMQGASLKGSSTEHLLAFWATCNLCQNVHVPESTWPGRRWGATPGELMHLRPPRYSEGETEDFHSGASIRHKVA
jgi:hypothetical protein